MARIHYKNGYFHGLGTWEEKELWKKAGFRYSPVRKAWITERQEVAESVKGVTWTPEAIKHIEHRLQTADISREMSYASTSTFIPPVPDGFHPRTGKPFKPFPYQCAGVEFALMRKDTLIADQPGLGKTLEGVLLFNSDPTIRRVLVVCPASLKEHWRREFELWKTRPATIGIAEAKFRERFQVGVTKAGKPKFKTVVHNEWWPQTEIVIINYDILHRFAAQINAQAWDLLICDEAHALKSDDSGRTLFVLGGRKREKIEGRWQQIWFNAIEANRRLFLTGTPMMNRPIELWPMCRAFDPEGLGRSYEDYGKRYCEGFWDPSKGKNGAWNFSGSSNLVELGSRLRTAFMIRRLKREVLPELPEKFRQVIVLDSPEIAALVAREDELAQALKLYESTVLREGETVFDRDARLGAEAAKRAYDFGFEHGDNPDRINSRAINLDYAAAVLGLEEPAVAVLFEEIAQVRRDLGLAKVSAVAPWVKNYLDGGEKLVLFAYHTDVIKALDEKLKAYNPATIWGGVPAHRRQPLVDLFQEDHTCRLIILQIDAGGVGYTLTAAHDVAFAEGDWVPTKMEQALDRVCRIGQEADKVTGFHLVANGSLDCRMAQSAFDKETNISAALDT